MLFFQIFKHKSVFVKFMGAKIMEKTPFKFICLFCCCLLSFSLNAQVLEDANGRPMLARSYTDVQGSPYFTDSWMKGSVRMEGGKTYAGVELKYDMVADELLFKNAKGEMLGFVDPVQEFRLVTADHPEAAVLLFRNGYKPTADVSAKGFYQVLSDGQTPFARRLSKKVLENKPYGSATTTRTFEEVTSYYVIKSGLPVKVRKDRKALLVALGDYSDELDEFIRINKLNLKSDADFILLMNYYNSLK